MRLRFPLAAVLVLAAGVAFIGCEDDDDGEDDDAPAAMAPAVMVDAFAPSDAERAEIVGVLQTLFDGLNGRPDLLRATLDPEVRMVYTQTDAEGTTSSGTSTLPGLTARVESAAEPLIERMWDPEIRIQGNIATIWTPYDFYVGTTFSHCGIDVATLMRGEDRWKVVALEWSRAQPPVCELHPEGPPGE